MCFFLFLHVIECMFYVLFTVYLTCVKNKRLFCVSLVIITYKVYIYYKVRVHYFIYIRKLVQAYLLECSRWFAREYRLCSLPMLFLHFFMF